MHKEELCENVIAILEKLSPHLPEAEELISAVKEGLEEELLHELAKTLLEASWSVAENLRRETLDSITRLVKERRAIEHAEREREMENAASGVDNAFI